MRNLRLSYLLPILLILTACATLGVPTPQSFNEKEAAAISTAKGVLETANSLLTADKIKAADAANIVKQTDNFMEAINLAETIHDTDAAGGDTRLDAAVQGLSALKAYLLTRK